ncbi:hypothetical protein TPB0596_19790 [Tsukamurella pulmonis]|uniref:hypothetical protein n=1 Tax=Tsukamurella pulmonis TaxID=47312 RepID=UPI001EE09D6B|nr:hypothetical protein [Tsukamurella pulmonis]BDD82216.1 hypothetical protein TPB0596_19790 [Tsukamurella pulmonis]
MAGSKRKVVFGRINRRNPKQETFEARAFADDMQALADSRLTTFVQPSAPGRPTRTWIAGDMTLTADSTFLTGICGYSEQQQQVSFDDSSFSWMKAEVADSDTASEQTIVPFAVDLRDKNRWIAFSTTSRMQPKTFRSGFEHAINQAVVQLGLMPTEWEVDLVTSAGVIQDWLRQHPKVFQLTRTIKFTNPGKNLDEDRRQMRALAANRKTEEFRAQNRGTLNIDSEEFEDKLVGTATGDIDINLKARGAHGVSEVSFNSRDSVDTHDVDDFGTNLQRGVDTVLQALREYVSTLEGPEQPQLTAE